MPVVTASSLADIEEFSTRTTVRANAPASYESSRVNVQMICTDKMILPHLERRIREMLTSHNFQTYEPYQLIKNDSADKFDLQPPEPPDQEGLCNYGCDRGGNDVVWFGPVLASKEICISFNHILDMMQN